MKMLKLSDEVFEDLKRYVVDPFDDTPDTVIDRLIEINTKAKNRWATFEESLPDEEPANSEKVLHEEVI